MFYSERQATNFQYIYTAKGYDASVIRNGPVLINTEVFPGYHWFQRSVISFILCI